MMKKKQFALILRGTSGAGKTSVSRQIAKEYKAVLLPHDFFLFELQPYKPETKEHFDLGNKHLRCCFYNALQKKKDIILEGAFVTFDKKINKFSIKPYIRELKENNYAVIEVMLTSSYSTAKKRKRKRMISQDVYAKLQRELRREIRPQEIVINTANKSEKQIVNQIKKLIDS